MRRSGLSWAAFVFMAMRRRELRLRCMASDVQVGAFQRMARHNLLATTGAVLIVIFVTCALFAPWIAPQDPYSIDLPSRLMSPSAAHWFGTDELGRDILSRVIYGARVSMLVGSCAVSYT